MGPIIASFIKKVLEIVMLQPLLFQVVKTISSAIGKYVYAWRMRMQIEKENREIREKNEAAKTKEERDSAAKDLLKRL